MLGRAAAAQEPKIDMGFRALPERMRDCPRYEKGGSGTWQEFLSDFEYWWDMCKKHKVDDDLVAGALFFGLDKTDKSLLELYRRRTERIPS